MPSRRCSVWRPLPSIRVYNPYLPLKAYMVTMATAAYGVQHTMAASTTVVVGQDAHQPANEEQYISTFFCRALYDYQTTDASSLSFHKNDIIEVLTRLESGWWDGLLGDERGWFPSNYVAVISDQEAEATLNGSEFSVSQPSSLADDSTVDMARSMSQALSQSDHDGDWLHDDTDLLNRTYHTNGHAQGSNGHAPQHNDFWVPQVSQDGRIFYVNTQTGQHSRDLPQEAEEDSDADLAALATSPISRVGPSAAMGLAALNGAEAEHALGAAGFGIPKQSRTPEPWVRRLADDGLSYYYVNRLDGSVSWTPPGSSAGPSQERAMTQVTVSSRNGSMSSREVVGGRMRSDSSASGRLSISSQDSDVHPRRRDRAESSANTRMPSNGAGAQSAHQMDLTPPEQLARSLQQALTPVPAESPVELSNHVREAIGMMMHHLQASTTPRRPEQPSEVDNCVLRVVATVRNLLYVTATPSGHIPSNLYQRDGREIKPPSAGQTLQGHLKAAQRKVAGTLSKLVLSALAMQYDPGLSASDEPNRMESDIAELERAVVAFVTEVHYFQNQNGVQRGQLQTGTKRLRGAFSTNNVGMGLPGAGAAGSWKGFGYVPLDESAQLPMQTLAMGLVAELKTALRSLGEKFNAIAALLKRADLDKERVRRDSQSVVAQLSSFLDYVGNIDVARHVDVDGVRLESGSSAGHVQYMQTVEKARLLVRTLEAATESLYDDGVAFFMAMQSMPDNMRNPEDPRDYIDALTVAVMANANVVVQSLEALVAVGFDQSDISQNDYRSSIEWRRSRSLDLRPPEEEVVDMELAFSSSSRTMNSIGSSQASSTAYYHSSQASEASVHLSGRSRSGSTADPVTPTWPPTDAPELGALGIQPPLEMEAPGVLPDDATAFFDEEDPSSSSKSPPRPAAAKIIKFFGPEAPQHYIHKLNADAKPWYLRPNYDQSEILMDPDGTVKAGTPSALVERLTAHEHMDTTFNQNFLMTFKSFMTVDELFELLVRRFWIPAPPNLSPAELEEWTKLKQHVIRMRVLNTFKNMVNEDGILEKEDMYILARMKEFASDEEVVNFAAAKQLLILVERVQKGGSAPNKILNSLPLAAPAPIIPRNSKKVKLLDIDPLELARQLTLMEAALYKKIRPMECLQRSREQKPGRNNDNITSIIQLSNRMANWVAESVLEKEDSRKRAAIVKHFIGVADKCRTMQNYSTMTAIVSGLATPPIRRLKRTWEQVNARIMLQLKTCESTIDTAKNFNNYRTTLSRIDPPCVPFIGVYLTTLTFINDGAEDKLAGNMINFRKRQKAAEVIQDIRRWQTKPYNFQTVGAVLSYLEECFNKYGDGVDYGDQFWNLSLEREPREREDEKMARLLQESGFL
ncbi:hypothetical protein AcW2_007229 [Taiwanofungus camphoratus]|nr:hypothetical protein AcW2_007229 [Antrodia cinnamomea]